MKNKSKNFEPIQSLQASITALLSESKGSLYISNLNERCTALDPYCLIVEKNRLALIEQRLESKKRTELDLKTGRIKKEGRYNQTESMGLFNLKLKSILSDLENKKASLYEEEKELENQ